MDVFCLLAWGLNFIAIKVQGHTVALALSLLYCLAATALVFLMFTWTLLVGCALGCLGAAIALRKPAPQATRT